MASASVVPDPSPARPLRAVRWYVCAFSPRLLAGGALLALVALLGLALAYASRTQRPVVAS